MAGYLPLYSPPFLHFYRPWLCLQKKNVTYIQPSWPGTHSIANISFGLTVQEKSFLKRAVVWDSDVLSVVPLKLSNVSYYAKFNIPHQGYSHPGNKNGLLYLAMLLRSPCHFWSFSLSFSYSFWFLLYGEVNK